ncbi:DUF2207 domain-containing protein [Tepidiforma sp.]|uniref:DUF2207 domain-containing protein n=1 Tax=Tepidiforma sp. TaxID=2682230 RepID=UPI0021DE2E58|nr:DUF2207 domain-containing protein [Tepidiforma sp.]MCX7617679.1 DUF2207 domain-containing protein [Tepidiforma sp.]GIW17813.1 MAG: hypothetical protein KatS3mg064_0970 [Tepidiforma sp.]
MRARYLLLAGAVLLVLAALAGGRAALAQESGWSVTSFEATYRVGADGVVEVEERIAVNFRALERHGIYRDLFETAKCGPPAEGVEQPLTPCPEGWVRKWVYADFRVTDANGQPWKFERESLPGTVRLKIGDPDVTVSGQQTYVIRYRLERALDAYADHDELYWNVTGQWQVPIERFAARVELPAGAALRTACYVGSAGAQESCAMAVEGSAATFSARRLNTFEQATIAVGWQKGVVTVPPPKLIEPAKVSDYLKSDAIEWGGFALTAALGLAAALALWWRHGRDRQYRGIYYLTNDPTEQTRPLFGGAPLVVEYLPPEELRPAQMGVLLDESADTLDVTATIIDLAVRGYLHITEIPKQGLLGKTDWELERKKDGSDLLPYERSLLDALFEEGDRVKVSDLKYEFATHLSKTKDLIYDDAMARGWFALRPGHARHATAVAAVGWILGGIGLAFLGATFFGRGLALAGFGLGGIALLVLAPSMARRTAKGSEALRRVLGFRLYIATAEQHRQEFNERENIFARYLPYAIVFGCVEKWAKAFEGLDDQARQSTAAWYAGTGPFRVAAFSEGLRSFNSSVGATLAATRSSGGSGFGGGGAGGGGGGGGGGSW